MKNKCFVVLLAALFVLGFSSDASAQTKKAQSYSSLIALKTAFVKSGGQCWEWSRNKQMFDDFINADCDQKTVGCPPHLKKQE